jgi:predicted RNase H-like HicB family nuclease
VQRSFDVVVERDEEGFYVASVPAIPGCHTQAKSLDELNRRIREAIELCLEVDGIPEQVLEFVGIQRITIAAWAETRVYRAMSWLQLCAGPVLMWLVYAGVIVSSPMTTDDAR